MAEKSWSGVAIAILCTALGGIAVVIFQEVRAPRPGLVATGQFVTFAPVPTEVSAAQRIGATAGYWHLIIQNTGDKKASDIRLRFPPSDVIQVQGKVERAPEGHYLPHVDLGTLGPGDETHVSGWTNVAVTPNLEQFTLSHGEGYGTVDVAVVGKARNEPLGLFTLLGAAISVLAATIATFMSRRLATLEKRTERLLFRLSSPTFAPTESAKTDSQSDSQTSGQGRKQQHGPDS